ncbi:helix-turn-helix domain-containing protein [Catenulispora yoronensis]
MNSQRVIAAQRILESTDLPVDEVARRSGFASGPAMRANFLRVLGTQPARYREAYLASRAAVGARALARVTDAGRGLRGVAARGARPG